MKLDDNMNTTSKIIAIVVLSLALSLGSFQMMVDDNADAADTSFQITDGTGTTYTFNELPEHIVTFGFATTLTIAEAGAIDKIIACDQYSQYTYYKDERLKDLDAHDLGSPFTNDWTATITWLLQAVESGDFDLEKDVVVGTNSTKVNTVLKPALLELGFKNILFWGTFSEYSGLVDCVESLTMLAAGENNKMQVEIESIWDASKDTEKGIVDFIYLWYSSSNGIGIGINSALGASMAIAAGGTNIAADAVPSSGSFRYGGDAEFIQYLEDNPKAVVLLADNFEMTAEEFDEKYLGGSDAYNIYVMGVNWNNYCMDSIEGLATLSEYFQTVSDKNNPDDGGDNILIYIAVIIAAIIVIAGVVYYFTAVRKKNV